MYLKDLINRNEYYKKKSFIKILRKKNMHEFNNLAWGMENSNCNNYKKYKIKTKYNE